MANKDVKRVETAGYGDKWQITATYAATMSGEFLPVQMIYGGKTERCQPKHKFPNLFDVHHTPNHWSIEECSLRFIEKVTIPYIHHTHQELGKPEKALVLFDVFKGQTIERVHSI